MPLPDLLTSLTEAQREAVLHRDGPMLILAGPGSGKTRVVTHRIAHLLHQGVPAYRILALTFTNKAADEMRARVEKLAPGEAVWMSTFHRFAARMLRKYASYIGLDENFTIYDTSDSKHALGRVLESLDSPTLHYTPERIAATISWAKNNLVSPAEFAARPGDALGSIVAGIYPAYQKRLLTSSAVDFDDLLFHFARLLRDNPEIRATLDDRYRYILVDEYQDTNLAQYAIVRALSVDYPNLAVTGDPDQSIYGWRGANLGNILDFENDFPEVRIVRLERNYRSTKRILRVADHLIGHNVRRKKKALFTENDEGGAVRLVIYPSQRDEAQMIADRIGRDIREGGRRPRDFAIFYRINALSRSLEIALRAQGIPYQLVRGLEFYQRKEIKDVLSYAQLINNPRDDVAFLRIVNTPTRGIGRKTIQRLDEHAVRYGLSMLEAAREAGLIESLHKRAAVQVAKFVAMCDRLREIATAPVEEVLGTILSESGYRQQYEGSDFEEDQNRLANIEELLTDARQFDEQHSGDAPLEDFLEQACLVNDTDDWETSTDKVTLMTLHAAKGLEFPVVFVIAIEHGLLPHERNCDDPQRVEEERRLMFVGITRAQEELHLSYANQRDFRGQRRHSIPSEFLMQLPREELEIVELDDITAWYPSEPVVETKATPPTRVTTPSSGLTTAGQLAGQAVAQPPRVSPDAFAQGMTVIHPEYGPGKIISLSGEGRGRKATISFPTAGQKKFVLANCSLRPAGRL
ncbi:MAG: UvrD-helicase domain-containing protein [Pirellulales bacterium]